MSSKINYDNNIPRGQKPLYIEFDGEKAIKHTRVYSVLNIVSILFLELLRYFTYCYEVGIH